LLFALFTHPGRVRAVTPLLAAARRLGLDRPLRRGASRRYPRLRALARLAPPVRARAAFARVPDSTPARGPQRGRVGLLQGCVQRVFFHDVNAATVRVLAAEGFEVYAPPAPRCCGALLMHSGYEPEAIRLAKKTIAAFEGCDAVAVNAAGCGSAMKDYVHLLEDDPAWAERARAFSAKVHDVSELLAARGTVAERHPVPLWIAYHDACHLAHAQGVRSEPRALLGEIPELELLEPADWEICCGSAGLYNILEPEAAEQLGRRKAENLLATGAQAIAAGNPGCALQIAVWLKELGRPLPVYHPMQVLDASITGRRL
jgi:glycolate oxidase iron-sulfur subunit